MADPEQWGVFLATPCYGGMVTQAYMQSVVALMAISSSCNMTFTLGLLGQDALITRSRNTLVAGFLETSSTHLLFVDADIGFRSDDVVRLVRHGRHVVGAPYPLRMTNWGPSAVRRLRDGEDVRTAGLDYVGEPCGPPDENGLMRARYAGTGFLLISREAIESMVDRYPELRCRHTHVAGGDAAREIPALFDCLIEPETRCYLSEDYAFCHRWRAIGGEIWLDASVGLTHCGMSEFAGEPRQRWR